MDDLIDYICLMRKKLENSPYIDVIMGEITNIASDNWVQTGVPNLSKE